MSQPRRRFNLRSSSPVSSTGAILNFNGEDEEPEPPRVDVLEEPRPVSPVSSTGAIKDGGDPESEPEAAAEALSCAICIEPCVFPVELPCSHVFCYLCVKGTTQLALAQGLPARCAICRATIPLESIARPKLKDTSELMEVFKEDNVQWFYESRSGGWWQFEPRLNRDLEEAYQDEKDNTQLLIAGQMYEVDLKREIQYRSNNPTVSRKIMRGQSSCTDKKGVAGIRIDENADGSTLVTPCALVQDPRIRAIFFDGDVSDDDWGFGNGNIDEWEIGDADWDSAIDPHGLFGADYWNWANGSEISTDSDDYGGWSDDEDEWMERVNESGSDSDHVGGIRYLWDIPEENETSDANSQANSSVVRAAVRDWWDENSDENEEDSIRPEDTTSTDWTDDNFWSTNRWPNDETLHNEEGFNQEPSSDWGNDAESEAEESHYESVEDSHDRWNDSCDFEDEDNHFSGIEEENSSVGIIESEVDEYHPIDDVESELEDYDGYDPNYGRSRSSSSSVDPACFWVNPYDEFQEITEEEDEEIEEWNDHVPVYLPEIAAEMGEEEEEEMDHEEEEEEEEYGEEEEEVEYEEDEEMENEDVEDYYYSNQWNENRLIEFDEYESHPQSSFAQNFEPEEAEDEFYGNEEEEYDDPGYEIDSVEYEDDGGMLELNWW